MGALGSLYPFFWADAFSTVPARQSHNSLSQVVYSLGKGSGRLMQLVPLLLGDAFSTVPARQSNKVVSHLALPSIVQML